MKKLLLPALFAGIVGSAGAQSIYVKADVGYAWPGFFKTQPISAFTPANGLLGSDPANSSITPMENSKTTKDSLGNVKRSAKNVSGSYAEGFNMNLGVGYMINPYFGVDIGFTALFSKTITGEVITDFNSLLGAGATITTKTKSSGLSIMPGIFIRAAKPEWKLAPIVRVGLAIPVAGTLTHDITIDAPNANPTFLPGPTKVDLSVSTASKFSLGVNLQGGLSYQPHKMVQVFAVMTGQYLDVRAKKTTITKYNNTITVGGTATTTDYLATDKFLSNTEFQSPEQKTLSTYSREVEFVDELTPSSNSVSVGKQRGFETTAGKEQVDESKSRQELSRSASFSSVGIAVGVIVNFQIKKKSKKTTTPVVM